MSEDCCEEPSLIITPGVAASWDFSWQQTTPSYATVLSAQRTAPAVIQTTTPHNIPDSWPFTISGSQGMFQLNRAIGFISNVLNPTTLQLDEISTVNAPAYTGGGVIKFFPPMSLIGFTARFVIIADEGETVLTLTTQADPTKLYFTEDFTAVVVDLTDADTTALAGVTGSFLLQVIDGIIVVEQTDGLVEQA